MVASVIARPTTRSFAERKATLASPAEWNRLLRLGGQVRRLEALAERRRLPAACNLADLARGRFRPRRGLVGPWSALSSFTIMSGS